MDDCSGSALCGLRDILSSLALGVVDNIGLLLLFGVCIVLIVTGYNVGYSRGLRDGAKFMHNKAFIEGIKYYIKTKTYNAGDFPGTHEDERITQAKQMLAEEMRPKAPKI